MMDSVMSHHSINQPVVDREVRHCLIEGIHILHSQPPPVRKEDFDFELIGHCVSQSPSLVSWEIDWLQCERHRLGVSSWSDFMLCGVGVLVCLPPSCSLWCCVPFTAKRRLVVICRHFSPPTASPFQVREWLVTQATPLHYNCIPLLSSLSPNTKCLWNGL